jgi:hypothetical protein
VFHPLFPTWLGAAALAAVTVGFWLVVGRPLGVSGIWGRLLRLRDERAVDRAEALLHADQAQLDDALRRATEEAMAEARAQGLDVDALAAKLPEPTAPPRRLAPRPTVGMHALFLAGMIAGGWLARVARGAPADAGMGDSFAALFGTGGTALAVLFGGGLLVGLGARLAGGCPSGHGLSGASRLEPGSVVAAVSFMGAAVAVAFLLRGVAG